MEKYNIPDDAKVFGVYVETFPEGIAEAFGGLIKMFPPGDDRPYYGISECTKDGIIYKAAALEKYDGEAEKYGCETFLIEKGEYLASTVTGWRQKTACIKDVFEEMFRNGRADTTKPCVEIYKNDHEMVCLVKVDLLKNVHNEVESTIDELLQQLSSFNQEQINTVPFTGSWTAAQVGEHLRKSYEGILQILHGPAKPTEREPGAGIEQIKNQFLNFNIKMESPEFVVPGNIAYDRERLIKHLLRSRAQLSQSAQTLNLSETCLALSAPMLSGMTRLELIYFIIYHTQRHIRQLKNIAQIVLEKQMKA